LHVLNQDFFFKKCVCPLEWTVDLKAC